MRSDCEIRPANLIEDQSTGLLFIQGTETTLKHVPIVLYDVRHPHTLINRKIPLFSYVNRNLIFSYRKNIALPDFGCKHVETIL